MTQHIWSLLQLSYYFKPMQIDLCKIFVLIDLQLLLNDFNPS